MINQKRGKTVKDYYQIDKDHDLNSLLEMGLIKDVASFYEGNIFKYVYRHRNKNGLEDLKKARNYLNLLIKLEYGAETEGAPDGRNRRNQRMPGALSKEHTGVPRIALEAVQTNREEKWQ